MTSKRSSPNSMTNEDVAQWTAVLTETLRKLQAGTINGSNSDPPLRQCLQLVHRSLSATTLEDHNPSTISQSIKELDHQSELTPMNWSICFEQLLSVAAEPAKQGDAKKNGRKKSGSYFTPKELMLPLQEATLKPVVMTNVMRFAFPSLDDAFLVPPVANWTTQQRAAAEKGLLQTKVCDPSCGTGNFLISAADFLVERLLWIRDIPTQNDGVDTSEPSRNPTSELRQAQLIVLHHCIYGVELCPESHFAARISMWLWAGRPEISLDQIAPNIRRGDSLGGETSSANDALIDWQHEFPEVFDRTPSGFDVVLGNPPFANAIEGLISPTRKAELTTRFPEFIGTADLAYYFFALAHRITAPDGAVGLVLPRGILTARAAREFRLSLLAERPPCLILVPQSQSLFDGADIFVVLIALKRGAVCLGARETDGIALRPISITDDNWWAPLLSSHSVSSTVPLKVTDSIGNMFEVFASMTTGMAYDLVPFLTDDPLPNAARLVTTGLIDPAACKWGATTCRYLKQKYQRPVIRESEEMPAYLRKRMEKIRRPKILVAGLSLRVEAFLDRSGIYCGAVSTFTILDPEDDLLRLQMICDYLNSEAPTQQLVSQLGAHAMSGGRITLSKAFLANLPLPSEMSATTTEIV